MASGSKRQKLEEEPIESKNDDVRIKRVTGTMFLPPDIILDVEGIQLHVHKKVLADNSPVFKRMFEADFKEKHQKMIPLLEVKIEDFEEFLLNIYHPEKWQITENTVLRILPLADRYQVTTVKERCESFIIQIISQVSSQNVQPIDINTLLKYIFNAERYQLLKALPLALHLCAKHCIESVTKASEETPISEELLGKICVERVKLLDTLVKNKMKKGEMKTVMETMDLTFGMNDEDEGGKMKTGMGTRDCTFKRNYEDKGRLMEIYESNLTKACDAKLNLDTLLGCIIAGEQCNLKRLLWDAISIVSRCPSSTIRMNPLFRQISNETKMKIWEKRVKELEDCGTKNNLYLKD